MLKLICLASGYLTARTLSPQTFARWDRYVLAPARDPYLSSDYPALALVVVKGAMRVWVIDENPA